LPKGMTFRGIDGKQYALDQWRGQVVVVHFWSTTCSYEAVAEPKLNALAAEFAAKGAVVLGIAANANELGAVPDAKDFDGKDAEKLPYAKLRAKAKDSKLVHPILVDHEGVLGRLLDAKTTPHCFVFDKDGKLQYQGALDDDPAGKNDKTVRYVRDAVAALLAGAKPEVQSTKAYGSRTKFAPRTVPKKG
jgi:thiol-disulfide isomerase/thioredoxin